MTQPAARILVVDDEPHLVHVVRFKLEQAGLSVITASNGNVAYDMACRERPDLVITDFQMPGGDGLQLSIRLRGNPKTEEIPIVMLTARGHRAAPLAELAETNVRSLLAKPFSPRELLDKVCSILNIRPQLSGRRPEPGANAA